jgi:hypothetical protein
MKITMLCLAACAAVGMSSACLADDMVAADKMGGTKVGFLLKDALSNATLTVSGPDSFHASAYSKSGAVAIDLGESGPVEDGVYNYQITAATAELAKVRTPLDNGRDRAAEITPHQSMATSGTFLVKGGAIVKPTPVSKESNRDEPTGGTTK